MGFTMMFIRSLPACLQRQLMQTPINAQACPPLHASRKSITPGSFDAAISDLMPSLSTNIFCIFQEVKGRVLVGSIRMHGRHVTRQHRFSHCNLSTLTMAQPSAWQALPCATSSLKGRHSRPAQHTVLLHMYWVSWSSSS